VAKIAKSHPSLIKNVRRIDWEIQILRKNKKDVDQVTSRQFKRKEIFFRSFPFYYSGSPLARARKRCAALKRFLVAVTVS